MFFFGFACQKQKLFAFGIPRCVYGTFFLVDNFVVGSPEKKINVKCIKPFVD
jgi:hypothetical protein